MSLSARLRDEDGWHDVIVRNISSRGLMAECARPPARGAFVELRCGACSVVGHVRWSRGTRFGIRSQEVIDLAVLLNRPAKPRGSERRAIPRKTPEPAPGLTIAAREEKSRRVARYLDWGIVAIVGVLAGGLLASGAGTILKRPIERAEAVLADRRR